MSPKNPRQTITASRAGGMPYLRSAMLLFMAIILGLATQVTQAADATTGTIEGRVLNLSNGRYLSKALVKVEGTTIEALTNDFGEYTLREVPAGTIKITVSYTGQESKTVDLALEGGKTANQDIGLNQAKTGEDGIVVLDQYVVAQQRYKTAQEIAINEERQSVNIKSVIATDSFGHIPDGNIGEFVRFMPGIDVTYGGTYVNGADAASISVRGFGPENTAILIDGMAVSSPSPASLTRAVGLDMLSINNASRIEVTKVATPDMPSDSPGGAINLITRSAFEYAKPQVTAELNATFNTMDRTFTNKEPGPTNEKTYHTLPGGRVSVVLPLSKTLGFSVSVASDNKFQPNQRVQASWYMTTTTNDMRAALGTTTASSSQIMANAVGGSSIANPFLRQASFTDNPWNTFKQSGNIRLDWRPVPGLTINTNFQYSQYTGNNVSRRLQFNAERPIDWGDTYVTGQQYVQRVIGTTTYTTDGSSKGAMTIDARDKEGDTRTGYIKAAYTVGAWTIDGNFSRSTANGRYDDMKNGHYSGLDLSLSQVGNAIMQGISKGAPAAVMLRRRDGTEYDYTKMANWTLDNAATLDAKSGEAYQRDVTDQMALNVRRELDFLPWRIAAKAGGYRQVKNQSKWGRGTGYKTRYVGSSKYGVALNAASLIDDTYKVSPGFGMPVQEWADVYKLYQLSQAHPEYFEENIIIGNQTGNYQSEIMQKKAVKEESNAFYAMLEGKFLNNRLSVTGGARRKFSKVNGLMPYTDGDYLFLKDRNGVRYRDAVYVNIVPLDGSSVATASGTSTPAQIWADTALASNLSAAGIALPSTPYWSRNADNTGYLDGSGGTTATRGTSASNMDLARLRWSTRNVEADRWDPVTPSITTAYKLSNDIDLKLSWSRETKLADLESSSGGGYIAAASSAYDSTTGVTTITINNPGLLPERTNSWNMAVSYYTKSGGNLTVSGYYKQISNEWESVSYDAQSDSGAALARSVGYDPTSLIPGSMVKTTFNGANSSTKRGIEVELRQNLSIFGDWGKEFDSFFTYTYKTHGSFTYTGSNAAIVNKMPGKSQDKYSAGLSYSAKRLTLQARATYYTHYYDKNTTRYFNGTSTTANGPLYQLFNYYDDEYRVNVEGTYRLSEKYSLFASVNDAFRSDVKSMVYDVGSNLVPEYARIVSRSKYGATVTVGISGTF